MKEYGVLYNGVELITLKNILMQMYIMDRKGIFYPHKDTDNQCKDVGHKNYEYSCRVVFSPETELDEKDFLIDHIEVDKTITSCIIHGSCEGMHKIIMKALLEKFQDEGIDVLAVKVTIIPRYPDAMANLSYVYTKTGIEAIYLNV